MRRISTLWFGLVLVYAALIAWHQPLRGPLSEDEVRAALDGQFTLIERADDAQAEAFLDFFLNDDGRPFFMVNLNAVPEQTPEVKAAAREYGTFMLPQLLSRASYPVLSTDIVLGLTNSLGDDLTRIDHVVVVRYRSRRDFLEVVSSSEFQQKFASKGASLEGWYAAPSTTGATLSLPVMALCVLLLLGVVGTLRARHRAHANNQGSGFDATRRS